MRTRKKILKKNRLTPIYDAKLMESEFEVTRRKKNTHNVILYCFVRVGKTWFPVQFGVNKHELIFKDNKVAQARNLNEKSIRER